MSVTLISSQPSDWTNRPERTDEESGDRPEAWTLPPHIREQLAKHVENQRPPRVGLVLRLWDKWTSGRKSH